MIEVTVPDEEKLAVSLNLTRAKLLADLKREVKRVATDVSARTKDQKLSGQVLKVQSGRLRRSINYRTDETETGIEALVGTNVSYGRAHEFGFSGSVTVKAHLRTVRQAFGRKLRSAKKVEVRTHSRNVNLPERSFLRSSLREMRSEIDSRIARVVADSIVRSAKA